MIVAIEGVDGAGKHTLTSRLVEALTAAGRTAATFSFPRYTAGPLGTAVRAMLDGDERLAGVAGSARATAVLFALDRANALPELAARAAGHDVLLVDRYLASNAAYGAARLPADERPDFLAWIAELELTALRLPRPDLQVLLDVPVETARASARQRAAGDATRALDTFERDEGLQERCAAIYRSLAAGGWVAPWLVADRATGAEAVLDALLAGSARALQSSQSF
ncbi:thymidylate kinase [Frankia sp. CcI49]|uniref:dTMP kinase n=1 Tax=unclassified Frankia TaxID=2632575 RepID=UPI0006CA57AF|nr:MULTISPECIES: dTMP kinase [unclassified Frankia]KPM53849.1 thymidylate kinase [Frankia sp. R43]ONH54902.1 thymidylate kinase [Frankia sp. CcI49]